MDTNFYSEQEIINITKGYIKEFSKKLNIEKDLTRLPILINKRLTRALGRFQCRGGKSVKIDFSTKLLNGTYSNKTVIEIIKHEVVHYIVFEEGYINEIHGEIFRSYCKKLGCKFDSSSCEIEEINKDEIQYKYKLHCDKCNYVWRKNRMSNIIKNPQDYKCKCGGKIIVDK